MLAAIMLSPLVGHPAVCKMLCFRFNALVRLVDEPDPVRHSLRNTQSAAEDYLNSDSVLLA